MKKYVFISAFMMLGGCNSLTYDFAHDGALKGSEWQDANVPFDTAYFCKNNNIALYDYQVLSQKGINNLEDIKNISKVLPPEGLVPEYTDNGIQEDRDNFQKGDDLLNKIADGINKKYFSSEDILKLRQSALSMVSEGHPNYLGVSSDKIAEHSDDLLESLKNLHNGENIDSIISQSVQKMRNDKQRKIDNENNEIKRNQDEYYDNIKTIFGNDIFNECNGVIYSNVYHFLTQDPYANKGQCAELMISSFGGNKQYINANEILVNGTFMFVSDEHIKLDADFIAVVVDPVQYTNNLGELKTPVTFKVLKQK